MGNVALGGSIPAEQFDGLGDTPVLKQLIEHPRAPVLIIAVVVNNETRTRNMTGKTYPVLKIEHWETVPEEHQPEVRRILAAQLAARTGIAELPFEPGTELPLQHAEDEGAA